MTVRVLAFASLRDALGTAALAVSLAAPASAADVLDALEAEHPRLAPFRRSLRVAVNGRYVPAETMLAEGDEVALITPVSGG